MMLSDVCVYSHRIPYDLYYPILMSHSEPDSKHINGCPEDGKAFISMSPP